MILLFLAALLRAGESADQEPIDGKVLLDHVKWLADDDREGRAAGSEGEIAAGDYAAERLREAGLLPKGDDGTYFQGFTLPRGFQISEETSLTATRDGKSTEIGLGDDLQPLSLSGPGDVTAPACFAGYGIAAPELGYDDYEGIDVKGKAVVVLRHAPGYKDRKSPFNNPAMMRRYASFQAKVDTAVGAGAAALVIVNDPKRTTKPKEDVVVHAVGGNPGPIPVFHVTYRAARRLGRTLDLNFQREQSQLERGPRSRDLEGVEIRANAALTANLLQVRNVCALLEAPRETQQPRETLVIGAHIDHVGNGEYGSRAGSKGANSVHNGADDNASGVAGAIEIGRFLSARRDQLRRDVLVLLFTAEELGLLGSKHYVDNPVVPLEQCVAMINLDMIGRLERGRLQIGGTGTSPDFPDLIEGPLREHRITRYRFNPGGRAPSDNSSFYEKGMPVLFFFTGLHKDYHRPADDWNRIDRRGFEKVVRLAADVCLDLATRETRPPFTRSDASGLQAGPHLGLSFEQKPDGIYVIFVEDKSPADRARIEVGDKVEEFEDQPVPTITAFNQIHMQMKAEQKVTLVVRRGARLLTRKVTLGKE